MIKIDTKNTNQVLIDVKKSEDGKIKLIIDLDLSVGDLEIEHSENQKLETQKEQEEKINIDYVDDEYVFYIEETFTEKEFFMKLDDFLDLVDENEIKTINLVFKEKMLKEELQQILFKWVRQHEELNIMKPTDDIKIARIIFKIGDTKDFEFGTFNKFSYK